MENEKPVDVEYVDRGEIRDGSPFHIGRIILKGEWTPELPNGGIGYHGLFAWSGDDRYLALCQWNVRYPSDPGFIIHVIDFSNKKIISSERKTGCCETLTWNGSAFAYTAFPRLEGDFDPS